jgi:hypothetical protein
MQLTDRQRALLEERAAGRRRPHDGVQRAAMILPRADGARTRHVAAVFGGSDPPIRRWRARWVQAAAQLVAAAEEADEETLDPRLPPVWRDPPRSRPRRDATAWRSPVKPRPMPDDPCRTGRPGNEPRR